MNLVGSCVKCGSTCAPRWCKATDMMDYTCVCGYKWSGEPLDGPTDKTEALKKFEKIAIEGAKRAQQQINEHPLRMWIAMGKAALPTDL